MAFLTTSLSIPVSALMPMMISFFFQFLFCPCCLYEGKNLVLKFCCFHIHYPVINFYKVYNKAVLILGTAFPSSIYHLNVADVLIVSRMNVKSSIDWNVNSMPVREKNLPAYPLYPLSNPLMLPRILGVYFNNMFYSCNSFRPSRRLV